MSNIRLNKYVSEVGICSRRMADELIVNKKVKVNGNIAELGMVIDTENDIVEVNGKIVKNTNKKVYILLNKPTGYVTTTKEQFNRPCVTDLIKDKIRVYPVGRLDMDTSGLLILTNDGEFSNNVTHPKNSIYKTYEVETFKDISNNDIYKLQSGVDIGGYITSPAIIKRVSKNKIEVSICEGKNRQVRKMLEAIGNKVNKLNRISIGKLGLGNLRPGEYIHINKSVINKVFE